MDGADRVDALNWCDVTERIESPVETRLIAPCGAHPTTSDRPVGSQTTTRAHLGRVVTLLADRAPDERQFRCLEVFDRRGDASLVGPSWGRERSRKRANRRVTTSTVSAGQSLFHLVRGARRRRWS